MREGHDREGRDHGAVAPTIPCEEVERESPSLLILLFLEDGRVVHRLSLSILARDRVRPGLTVCGDHPARDIEHLAFPLSSDFVRVLVNLLNGLGISRVWIGLPS